MRTKQQSDLYKELEFTAPHLVITRATTNYAKALIDFNNKEIDCATLEAQKRIVTRSQVNELSIYAQFRPLRPRG